MDFFYGSCGTDTGKLHMAVGVIAEQMAFIVYPFYDFRVTFGRFPYNKKGCFYISLSESVQKF